jgi:hypothetical protein
MISLALTKANGSDINTNIFCFSNSGMYSDGLSNTRRPLGCFCFLVRYVTGRLCEYLLLCTP